MGLLIWAAALLCGFNASGCVGVEKSLRGTHLVVDTSVKAVLDEGLSQPLGAMYCVSNAARRSRSNRACWRSCSASHCRCACSRRSASLVRACCCYPAFTISSSVTRFMLCVAAQLRKCMAANPTQSIAAPAINARVSFLKCLFKMSLLHDYWTKNSVTLTVAQFESRYMSLLTMRCA